MNNHKQAIFITGRFRSGTSFLWQLFDQLDGYCAWYEPLHPQLLAAIEHTEPKADHVGIVDYWTAYRQHPQFRAAYSASFATQNLFLEPKDEYVELEHYINQLIELSGDDTAVIQFNRVDFRLSWLKAKFPSVKIIHITRNPLQLYYSQRKHINSADRNDVDYWDAYELQPWCYALSEEFPFLLKHEESHAFYPFYMLYQLSTMAATYCADVSINLDNHVFQSDDFLAKLGQVVALSKLQKNTIKSLTHVPEFPVFDADLTDQLISIMTAVDMKLMALGLTEGFAKQALSTIKLKHQEQWLPYQKIPANFQTLLLKMNELNSEMTRVLAENNSLKEQLRTSAEKLTAVNSEQPSDHE